MFTIYLTVQKQSSYNLYKILMTKKKNNTKQFHLKFIKLII